jgi:hypothetical protein
MEFSRHVSINWTGSVMEGSGMVVAGASGFGSDMGTHLSAACRSLGEAGREVQRR